IDADLNVAKEIENFSNQFQTEKSDFKFITQGLFGYLAYDAIQYFEKVSIAKKSTENEIPELFYAVYQNIIAINHFKNEAYLFC
ncbi:MAG: anthranilate synthase component I family protein, partial [Flavobacterium sp.]|nr:anthranilate synthase component I family protein [Flavobacterium sp.]